MKTYETDAGAINYGHEFEAKCIAFLLLQFLEADEYEAQTNVKDKVPLDDLIVTTKKRGIKRTYYFQIKHSRNEENSLTKDDFIKARGRKCKFDLAKIYDAWEKHIKVEEDPNSSKIIIFTNRVVDTTVVEAGILEYGAATNRFTFMTEMAGKIYKIKSGFQNFEDNFVNNVYLYCEQMNVDKIKPAISKILQKLYRVNDCEEFCQRYIEYITGYNNMPGPKFELDKSIVQRILTFAYFQPYLYHNEVKQISVDRGLKTLWLDIISANSYNLELPLYLKHEILHLNKEEMDESDDLAKFYLTLLYKDTHPTSGICCNINAIICNTPWILTVTKENIETIQTFAKINKGHEVIYLIKKPDKVRGALKNVELSRESIKFLQEYRISIQGKKPTKMRKLLQGNQFLTDYLENVQISDLLKIMSTNNQLIGNSCMYVNDYIISRKFYNIVLEEAVFSSALSENVKDIFVVSTLQHTVNTFAKEFKVPTENVVYLNKSITGQSISEFKYILVKDMIDVESYFNDVLNVNIHYVRIKDNEILWINTNGDIRHLQNYIKRSKLCNSDEQLLQSFHNNLLIIVGKPGIGKTLILKRLRQLTPKCAYTIYIDLKQHTKYLKELHKNNYKFQIDDCLNKFNGACLNSLEEAIFKNQCNERQIMLFIDGFDEVAPRFTKTVIKLVNAFQQYGLKTVLASRSTFKADLEKHFNTFAIKLLPFTEIEKQEYLKRQFSESYDKIMQNCKLLDSKIFTIPLYLKLAAHYIQNNVNDTTVNMLDIYEHFVSDRIKSMKEIIHCNADDEHILRYHKALAIKQIFENCNGFSTKYIDKEIHYFENALVDGRERSDFICKNSQANFIHRSIAEYFAAKWLIDVACTKSKISQSEVDAATIYHEIMWNKVWKNVLLFVNMMVCKHLDIHLKIIGYGNISENSVLQHCTVVDIFDRNPVHMLIRFYKDEYLSILKQVEFKYWNQKDCFGLSPFDYAKRLNIASALCIYQNGSNADVITKLELNKKDILMNVCKLDLINTLSVLGPNVFNDIKEYLPLGIQEACKYGSRNVLAYFMDNNLFSNINQQFLSDWKTAMHIATEYNHIHIIPYLLSKEAEYNLRDAHGKTVLHYAAATNINALKMFLYKINVDCKDNSGNTPLHYAILNCKDDIVDTLLQHNASVHTVNKEGASYLHVATQRGNMYAIKKLIEHGINVNTPDVFGKTALSYALDRSYKLAAEYIIQHGFDVNDNYLNKEAIHKAAQNGFDDCVRDLIKNGAEVDHMNRFQKIALHYACENSQAHAIQTLLYTSPEKQINKCDNTGFTPLHYIAQSENVSAAEILLKYKADVNSKNNSGETPLHVAIENGNIQMVKLLIENKANPYEVNDDGMNALHYCCKYYKNTKNIKDTAAIYNHIKEMFPKDKLTCDANLKTAFHYAAEAGFMEPIIDIISTNLSYMETACAKGETLLISASKHNHPLIVSYLIKNGAHLNHTDKQGKSALHHAAFNGFVEIVKLLLQHNIDVDLQDNQQKRTALHYASEHGHISVVKALLKAGCNPSLRDYINKIPLHWALESSFFDVSQLLIAGGSDVNLPGWEDKYPIHYASRVGNLKLIGLLIQHNADIQVVDNLGRSAAHHAANNKHLSALQLLKAHGANMELVDKNGKDIYRYFSEARGCL